MQMSDDLLLIPFVSWVVWQKVLSWFRVLGRDLARAQELFVFEKTEEAGSTKQLQVLRRLQTNLLMVLKSWLLVWLMHE